MRTTADEMNAKSQRDCIMDLMGFLINAEIDGAMYGGVDAIDAIESVQAMLGYDDERFEKLKDVFR